jgi:hypothetical protein
LHSFFTREMNPAVQALPLLPIMDPPSAFCSPVFANLI